MNKDVRYLVVDLFCGAGGVTTGFAQAALDGNPFVKVVACINHDHKAIKSHWANHPEVIHFEEDIRTLELSGLVETVEYWRSVYPNALVILWGSLECTNYSKAKGGKEKDADSRTLMYALYKHWNGQGYGKSSYEDGKSYIQYLNPDYIMIENVEEFKSRNEDFADWCRDIDSFGYRNEWKTMNSADFGAYTSRNRLFGCFAKEGLPIVWPQATHAKKIGASKKSLLHTHNLQQWKPVKDVLDFSDEGESIFNRKKPLVDKSLARIYAGLLKYVANGDKSFIAKYFSGRPKGKVTSVDNPLGAITTSANQAVVQPVFLMKYNSTDKNGKHTPPSLDQPCPVISTQGRLGVVSTTFIDVQYGNGYVTSTEEPLSTQTTKPRHSIVEVQGFAATQIQGVHQPAGTILTNDKHRVINTIPFIMDTQFNNTVRSIEDPMGVITANRKHHYLINPSYPGNPTSGVHSTEQPSPVIVASQNKAPLRMITVEHGLVQIPIYDTDSDIMIKIKEFMVIYGLVDIKMRMLRVQELKIIQGFPASYMLDGTQADQKKFIGNSVVPQVVKVWIEAMANVTTPEILMQYKNAA